MIKKGSLIMSTNLFTAEQEAFLKKFHVDTSLPIFPLSCEVACRTMNFKNIMDDYNKALAIKAKGGYESEKEHKKKYIKKLIFGGGYHFHIFLFLVLALIVGTIVGFILQIKMGYSLLHLSDAELAFCRIMRYTVIALFFVIFNAISLFSYLSKNRENIEMEMDGFSIDVSDYHKALKDYEENYQTNKENYQMFLEIMRIITADREAIPEKYWRWGNRFLSYYNDRKANNVTEAIRVLEEEQHRYRLESEMERQTELANQANIAAQEALQTARNAQASASIAAGIANSNDHYQQNRY